jgi:threonine dehydrogenase-like Zn-dependent dehydrogenase
VRLEGCGVCGSNLPVWQGRSWFNYPLAAGAPGHEGWGRVEAVGTKVTSVQVGSRVAMLSHHAFAEVDVTDHQQVVALPAELDCQPFPGEALGCAMNVIKRADIQRGQQVAIVGIGFLGALLTDLAAKAGAEVIAVSRRAFALDVARQMGASHTLVMGDDRGRTVSAVNSLTEGRGCDRVIEASGAQFPLDLAAELTAVRGKLIIAGYHQDGPRQVNMQLWNWRGLDVINAHEREPQTYLDGIRAAALAVATGAMDPTPLYTHRFALDELPTALESIEKRHDQFLKGLILYA